MTKADPKRRTEGEEGEENQGDGNAHNLNKQPLEVLRVRYNGRSDQRVLNRNQLLGNNNEANWGVSWTPCSEVPYDVFWHLVGSQELASQILRAHKHEFELVGPGSEQFWTEAEGEGEEEFSIGGVVE